MAFLGLAEVLCDNGIGLLRFDYAGTGDSGGRSSAPGQLESWRASVRAAVDYACVATEAPCVVIGMRLGAILASEIAREDQRIKGLVLWDPVFSAKRYLREQKAFVASVFRVAQPADGSFAGAGYSLDRESVAALETLQLGTCHVEVGSGSLPTLLAARHGDRAASSFVEAGADHVVLEGQAELMEMPPHEVRLSLVDLASIAGWISERAGHTKSLAQPAIVDEAEVLVGGGSVVGAGRPVIERFRRLGSLPLFGIETLPADVTAPSTKVVFLSAGALERMGPARLWADLARELANRGVASIRVDNAGVGDSPVRGQVRRGQMLDPSALTDLTEIAEALGAPDGSGLIFVGLSSGAYHAAEAGLSLRPAAVCMINGSEVESLPELSEGCPVDPRRRAYKPMWPAFRHIAISHERFAKRLWQAFGNIVVKASPASLPVEIAERGVKVLMIATGDDRREFAGNLYWRSRAKRARSRGLYTRYGFSIDDHPLYTEDARRLIRRVLIDFIVEQTNLS